MLIADAECHRYRHDATEDRRPEHVDELLVVAEEQDQLVAAARADALQVIEDAERALVQLGKGHLARIILAFEVSERARESAVVLDDFREGRGFGIHRASSLMCNG
jgi:vacuolar-type H+-ATPase subunit H